LLLILCGSSFSAFAQQDGNPYAPAPAQQPAQQPESPPDLSRIPAPQFRILAGYDYSVTSPSALNNYRSQQFWNNTTATKGTFSAMNGYTVGGGLRAGPGFLGVEYSSSREDLSNTQIGVSTLYVQDTFEYDSVFALYDIVFDLNESHTFELGGGVGYAIKYRYNNILSTGGTQETVAWEDHPMAFKVRAYYNYHFTPNLIVRAGAQYELVTSSDMTADSNHPTVILNGGAVLKSQKLRTATGENVKVDMSGLRLSVAGVFAF